jgi:hypothetical protein
MSLFRIGQSQAEGCSSFYEGPAVAGDPVALAAESSDLAKSASSPFLRRYYQGLAERYLMLAQGELSVSERQSDVISTQSDSSTIERSGT